MTGNLTWNANGTLGSLLITDLFNAANTQNCICSHDDLVRIAGVNCGSSTFQQTFRYDPVGNITKSSAGGGYNFAATYSATTNHILTVAGTLPTMRTVISHAPPSTPTLGTVTATLRRSTATASSMRLSIAWSSRTAPETTAT